VNCLRFICTFCKHWGHHLSFEGCRGVLRIAVDHDHQMMAVGWVDNRAVHFISTADTTDT
jgi:hypothetical protein